MGPADLRRYHRLLLKKQREVSSALGAAQYRVQAAGGVERTNWRIQVLRSRRLATVI